MTTIYVTRHGETEWNLEGRMQGRKNSSLTALGEEQAVRLGERLADVPFEKVISSSSGRAKQTAQLIIGDRDIEMLDREEWQEIDLGPWEGKLKEELEDAHGEEFRRFWEQPHTYQPVQGESFQAVIHRVGAEIEKLAESKKPVLVVTHALALKALLSYVLQKQPEDFWTGKFMHQTALTVIEKKEGTWQVVMEADCSHHKEVEA
ncbi:histidine phosphatase family protein [Halobacillus litoralis]|uniref:histidine phosphatase family protein n=1 Tax=Halobacillus litoralis TaxID=45668 RepID=UPI001CD7ED53|nr:histidine phosphatase family protein [Halobacillus litoralis]MCA0972303.1 histidine phosphatase family protein [Halobacillus litoralis]